MRGSFGGGVDQGCSIAARARPSAARVPSGQYFAASSTALACATDETIGTIALGAIGARMRCVVVTAPARSAATRRPDSSGPPGAPCRSRAGMLHIGTA